MTALNSIVWKNRMPNQGDPTGTIRPSNKTLAEPAVVLSTKQLQALRNTVISFFELENKKSRTSVDEDREHWAKNIRLLEEKVNGLKSVLEKIACDNPHLKRKGVEGAGLKITVNVFDYKHDMKPSKAVRMHVGIKDGTGKNTYREELVFRFSSSIIVWLDTKTTYDRFLGKYVTMGGDAHLFASYKDDLDKGMLLLRFNQVAERIMKENSG